VSSSLAHGGQSPQALEEGDMTCNGVHIIFRRDLAAFD